MANTLAYFVMKKNYGLHKSLKQAKKILLVTIFQRTNTLAYLVSLKMTEKEHFFGLQRKNYSSVKRSSLFGYEGEMFDSIDSFSSNS